MYRSLNKLKHDKNMANDTQIQFRITAELKDLAKNKGINLSEVSRNAIRAAVHEEKTNENE